VIRRTTAAPAIVTALDAQGAGDATYWLVLTQDCDLLQKARDKEPWCELLACKQVKKPDGRMQQGKNPRRIHFPFTQDSNAAWLQASVHDRVRISRPLLQDATPDQECFLSSGTVRTVVGWFVRRYTRSAFPDNFNNRIETAGPAVDAILRTNGGAVDAIFVLLNDHGELLPDQPYTVEVIAVMRFADYGIQARRDAAQAIVDTIEAEWGRCPGIVVRHSEVKAEKDVTLEDLRFLYRWDGYDFLSNSDEEEGESAR
jgi:hypothetical protein